MRKTSENCMYEYIYKTHISSFVKFEKKTEECRHDNIIHWFIYTVRWILLIFFPNIFSVPTDLTLHEERSFNYLLLINTQRDTTFLSTCLLSGSDKNCLCELTRYPNGTFVMRVKHAIRQKTLIILWCLTRVKHRCQIRWNHSTK